MVIIHAAESLNAVCSLAFYIYRHGCCRCLCAHFFCSPCGHSCTISLCKVNFVLWWLLYKSRASQRAVEGCVLFIVSLVDCWTLHCFLFPIRFGGETLALETLRRNYLLVIRSMLLQSRPHWFTFRSSWGQSKVWVILIFYFFFPKMKSPNLEFWTKVALNWHLWLECEVHWSWLQWVGYKCVDCSWCFNQGSGSRCVGSR